MPYMTGISVERFPLVFKKLAEEDAPDVFLAFANFCDVTPGELAEMVEKIILERESGAKRITRPGNVIPLLPKDKLLMRMSYYTQMVAIVFRRLFIGSSSSGFASSTEKGNYFWWEWK